MGRLQEVGLIEEVAWGRNNPQELLFSCGGVHPFIEEAGKPIIAFPGLRAIMEALPSEPDNVVAINPPWGVGRPHDTDMIVREYEIEAGEDKPLSVAIMKGSNHSGAWVYQWHIVYNLTKIVPLKPTPEGMRLLRRHERYHCKGFVHEEGTPAENGCYSRTVNLWA